MQLWKCLWFLLCQETDRRPQYQKWQKPRLQAGTPKGQHFCQQLVVSHQSEPPFPWEGHLGTPGSWGTESPGTRTQPLHPQTASHLGHWHFMAWAPKPNWLPWHPSLPLNPQRITCQLKRFPFFFGVKCWEENSQIYSKVAHTSREEGQTKLNDHFNPECID